MSHSEPPSPRAPEPDPPAIVRHELTEPEWRDVVSLARSFLARSRLQAADRDEVAQETLLVFVVRVRQQGVRSIGALLYRTLKNQERKRLQSQPRVPGALPEDGALLPSGAAVDVKALLCAVLAEMPEPERTWLVKFLTTGPEPELAESTLRWRRMRILRWLRGFFS